MKVEEIKDRDTVLALIVRGEEWEEGLNFVSSNEDFLQIGVWWYDKEKVLEPHIHLNAPRLISHTQEVVFVKEGRIRANIYTQKEKFLISVELKAGDIISLLKGGHGYEILEEDTKILEVKNGPYVGPDKDRKRI